MSALITMCGHMQGFLHFISCCGLQLQHKIRCTQIFHCIVDNTTVFVDVGPELAAGIPGDGAVNRNTTIKNNTFSLCL